MEEITLVDKIIKTTVKEDLLIKYSSNTLLRSLVQIVPYGALVDTMLTTSYNNILFDRAKVFYDEIGKGMIELTPELINSEDFLHAYFSSYKAALYTKQREKIRFISRLLKNGLISGILSKADEYDDYLKILDELTYREITLLYILDSYQGKVENDENQNALERTSSFWSYFVKQSCELLSINTSELNSILTRIQRTGCYYEFTGGFTGYSGGRGEATEIFAKLKSLIELNKEDLVYYRKL